MYLQHGQRPLITRIDPGTLSSVERVERAPSGGLGSHSTREESSKLFWEDLKIEN